MTEEQLLEIIIGLLVLGLFKERLAKEWYYLRKHLFWRPVGQKVQRWWKRRGE